MPTNKTFYVKDADIPIWEKARQLAGDKLSSLVTEYLKHFVAMKDAEMAGFSKITLRYRNRGELPRAQSFHGKWLVAPEDPWIQPRNLDFFDDSPQMRYAVALTSKRQIAIFQFHGRSSEEEEKFLWGELTVFSSLEEAPKVFPSELIALAMERLGLEVEELDI